MRLSTCEVPGNPKFLTPMKMFLEISDAVNVFVIVSFCQPDDRKSLALAKPQLEDPKSWKNEQVSLGEPQLLPSLTTLT